MERKTVLLTPPKNFLLNNIITEGNTEGIYKNYDIEVDECIAEEIKKLWAQGIHTQGCCCGHQTQKGFIQVERTDLAKMLELGYEWYTDYPEELGGKNRMDAFVPKSKCNCELRKQVTFLDSQGNERIVAYIETKEEATQVIKHFLEIKNYKAPYWRINFHPEYLEYDVGSWSEFFRVYDFGEFREN